MTAPVNVADYFDQAAEKVDPKIWCFFEGGAGDEITLRAVALPGANQIVPIITLIKPNAIDTKLLHHAQRNVDVRL